MRVDPPQMPVDEAFAARLAGLAAATHSTSTAQPRRRLRAAALVIVFSGATMGGGLGVAYATGAVSAPWTPTSSHAPSPVPRSTTAVPSPADTTNPGVDRGPGSGRPRSGAAQEQPREGHDKEHLKSKAHGKNHPKNKTHGKNHPKNKTHGKNHPKNKTHGKG